MNRRVAARCTLVLALAALAPAMSCYTQDTPGRDPASAPLFDPSSLVEIRLAFDDVQWGLFQEYRANQLKNWVHCSFSFAGRTFADAACRSKGDSADWKVEKKPQFLVRFDEWDGDGRFLGLRSVNLEAGHEHAAPLRDLLGMRVMEAAGVPAPRVNLAVLYVNDAYYGPYENIETIDKEFLKGRFWDEDGNLYEQGSTLVTNRSTGSTERLEALQTLVAVEPNAGDHAAFWEALDGLMDMDQVLLELAVEALLPTWDNFSNGSWNFYYYDHPRYGFQVLPWDLDDCMVAELGSPVADLYDFRGHDPTNPNKLRRLINANPVWKAAFEANVARLRDGEYARLPEVAATFCGRVRSAYETDPYRSFDLAAFDADCASFGDFVAARTAYLRGVLGR